MPDGPGRFRQDFSCPALLGIQTGTVEIRVRGSHALLRAFPNPSALSSVLYVCPTTPPGPEPGWFRLCPVRSPLLGVSQLFSLPAGTGMFRFPALAPVLMYGRRPKPSGCPVRTPADQRLLAPPRRFSQLATSFFASWSLGIHRPPLFSFLFDSARIATDTLLVSRFFFFSMSMISCEAALRLPQCPAASAAAVTPELPSFSSCFREPLFTFCGE